MLQERCHRIGCRLLDWHHGSGSIQAPPTGPQCTSEVLPEAPNPFLHRVDIQAQYFHFHFPGLFIRKISTRNKGSSRCAPASYSRLLRHAEVRWVYSTIPTNKQTNLINPNLCNNFSYKKTTHLLQKQRNDRQGHHVTALDTDKSLSLAEGDSHPPTCIDTNNNSNIRKT